MMEKRERYAEPCESGGCRHEIDYLRYRMRPAEWLGWFACCLAGCLTVGSAFFGGWAAGLALTAATPILFRLRSRHLAERRRDMLRLQFKDCLYFLSASMSAGKPLYAAIDDAWQAMHGMDPDGRSDLVVELSAMRTGLSMHEPLERMMRSLAVRSGLEEIAAFADVVSISLRTGGNLIEVMQGTARVIRDKVEVLSEIRTMIAAKRLEQRALSVSPVLMLLFIRSSSPEFMAPMYATTAGRVIMGTALLLTIAGFLLGDWIMRIKA